MSKLARLAVALPVLAAVVTGLGTGTTSAYASGAVAVQAHSVASGRLSQNIPSICGNQGLGYCLNDWNGTIGNIMMYYGSTINDSFSMQPLDLCNKADKVLGYPNYCPFGDHNLDNSLSGDTIVQLESGVNPGWCVGSSTSSSKTIMQPCNNPNTGTGGGTGTVLVQAYDQDCAGGAFIQIFTVRYWSDRYSTQENLESGNALGAQADEDYSGSSPTCWGNVYT